MLPFFRGGTRMRASLARARHAVIAALGLADRQAIDDLAARAARIEGRLARMTRR